MTSVDDSNDVRSVTDNDEALSKLNSILKAIEKVNNG